MDKRIKFFFPLLSLVLALYGVYHYLKSVEENACEMTYMFEYPEYLKIPLGYNTTKKFPRYNLYAYAEGKYTEELNANKFRGVPVLFIPGNAGSYRQVRSLGSVALRMSQSRQIALHFNFFSIDFNEEISALYGGVLQEQTEFVLECIKHIQELYSKKQKLILIGHSMGGVLAKAVFTLPNFKPSDILLIYTLASPHLKPVISMDSSIANFYDRTNNAWKYRMKKELRNIPIISIGGGQRDVLVRSNLIFNNFEHSNALDFHVMTSSIPSVWLSTDHLAIVWCKQLVLTICRSLFDIMDLQSNEATSKPDVLENVLRFHFVAKSSGKSWSPSWFLPMQAFSSSAQWVEPEQNPWRFARTKVLSSIYVLIPFSKSGRILIIASGLAKGEWIFGCTQSSNRKSCDAGENISNLGKIIPSRKAHVERRMINLNIEDLQQKGYSSLVIYVAPVTSQVEILTELYKEESRSKHYQLPSFERLFSFGPHRVFTISLVEQSVFYNVSISRGVGMFQAVEFQLETRLCRAGSTVGQGLIKVQNTWSGEITYHHIRASLGGITHVPVIIHSLPPAPIPPIVNLEFFFDPECSVVLVAKFPLYLLASQFMKLYGVYLLGYTVAFLITLISSHFSSLDSEGIPPGIYELFGKFSSYMLLVILPSFLYFFLRLTKLSLPPFPKLDIIEDPYEFLSSFILRTVWYCIAYGIALSLYAFLELLLKAISTLMMLWRHESLLKSTQVPLNQIPKHQFRISKSILVFSSVLAAVCIGISSSIASVMTTIYYFFKLSGMHSQCKLEEDRRGSSTATCKWYLHSLLVLLWIFAILLTYPGLVMWWINLKFSIKLSRDLYVIPLTIMMISSSVLWQLSSPFTVKYKCKTAAFLLKCIALSISLYGITSIYRLLYFIPVVFSIISIQQTFGYFYGFTHSKHD